MKLKKLIELIDSEENIEVVEVKKRVRSLKRVYICYNIYIVEVYISNACTSNRVFSDFYDVQDYILDNELEVFNIIEL